MKKSDIIGKKVFGVLLLLFWMSNAFSQCVSSISTNNSCTNRCNGEVKIHLEQGGRPEDYEFRYIGPEGLVGVGMGLDQMDGLCPGVYQVYLTNYGATPPFSCLSSSFTILGDPSLLGCPCDCGIVNTEGFTGGESATANFYYQYPADGLLSETAQMDLIFDGLCTGYDVTITGADFFEQFRILHGHRRTKVGIGQYDIVIRQNGVLVARMSPRFPYSLGDDFPYEEIFGNCKFLFQQGLIFPNLDVANPSGLISTGMVDEYNQQATYALEWVGTGVPDNGGEEYTAVTLGEHSLVATHPTNQLCGFSSTYDFAASCVPSTCNTTPEIELTFSQGPDECSGEITATTVGGGQMVFNWAYGQGEVFSEIATSSTITGLCDLDPYSLVVVDLDGCVAYTNGLYGDCILEIDPDIMITNPDCDNLCSGAVEIIGIEESYQYDWVVEDQVFGSTSVTDLCVGQEITLKVIDKLTGCKGTINIGPITTADNQPCCDHLEPQMIEHTPFTCGTECFGDIEFTVSDLALDPQIFWRNAPEYDGIWRGNSLCAGEGSVNISDAACPDGVTIIYNIEAQTEEECCLIEPEYEIFGCTPWHGPGPLWCIRGQILDLPPDIILESEEEGLYCYRFKNETPQSYNLVVYSSCDQQPYTVEVLSSVSEPPASIKIDIYPRSFCPDGESTIELSAYSIGPPHYNDGNSSWAWPNNAYDPMDFRTTTYTISNPPDQPVIISSVRFNYGPDEQCYSTTFFTIANEGHDEIIMPDTVYFCEGDEDFTLQFECQSEISEVSWTFISNVFLPAVYTNEKSLTHEVRQEWVAAGGTGCSIKATTKNGCVLTKFIHLLYRENPEIDVVAISEYCATDTIQFEASGADTYLWLPDMNIDSNTIYNPTIMVDTSTTYIVKGFNEFGCYDEVEISPIDSLDHPPVYPEFEFEKLYGCTFGFTASPEIVDGGYDWEVPDLDATNSGIEVQFDFPNPGYYDVTLSITDSCGTYSATEKIRIELDQCGCDE